jgi:hypothetical protein
MLAVETTTATQNQNSNPMQIMKDFLKTSTEIFGTSRLNTSKSVAERPPNFKVEHEMHSIKNLNPDAIK